MTEIDLILKRQDRRLITILTFNRPGKLNALNNDLINAVMAELDRIELDSSMRVVRHSPWSGCLYRRWPCHRASRICLDRLVC